MPIHRTCDDIANEYTVSLENQNVKVWGPSLPSFEEVKAKIAKTGKTVSLHNRQFLGIVSASFNLLLTRLCSSRVSYIDQECRGSCIGALYERLRGMCRQTLGLVDLNDVGTKYNHNCRIYTQSYFKVMATKSGYQALKTKQYLVRCLICLHLKDGWLCSLEA